LAISSATGEVEVVAPKRSGSYQEGKRSGMARVCNCLRDERQQDTLAGALAVVEVGDGVLQEHVCAVDWVGFELAVDGEEEESLRGVESHGGEGDVAVERRPPGHSVEVYEAAINDVACVVVYSQKQSSRCRKRAGVGDVEVLVHRSHLLSDYILQQEQILGARIDLDASNPKGDSTRSADNLRFDNLPPDEGSVLRVVFEELETPKEVGADEDINEAAVRTECSQVRSKTGLCVDYLRIVIYSIPHEKARCVVGGFGNGRICPKDRLCSELSGSKVVVRSEEVRENHISWDFVEQEQIIVRHERSKGRS